MIHNFVDHEIGLDDRRVCRPLGGRHGVGRGGAVRPASQGIAPADVGLERPGRDHARAVRGGEEELESVLARGRPEGEGQLRLAKGEKGAGGEHAYRRKGAPLGAQVLRIVAEEAAGDVGRDRTAVVELQEMRAGSEPEAFVEHDAGGARAAQRSLPHEHGPQGEVAAAKAGVVALDGQNVHARPEAAPESRDVEILECDRLVVRLGRRGVGRRRTRDVGAPRHFVSV